MTLSFVRTARLRRVCRRWFTLLGVALVLPSGLLAPGIPAAASPSVSVTSTFQWFEQARGTTMVHLGGEVTNNDSVDAGLIQVHYTLYAGSTPIGPETVNVWENGADILPAHQATPYQEIFPKPNGYTHAVLTTSPVTATTPLTPADQTFTVTSHDCPELTVQDHRHVCGTVTNNNGTTVDHVRVIISYRTGGVTVDADAENLNTNPTDSLAAHASADFEVVRASSAPDWTDAPLMFAESTTTAPGRPGNVSATAGNGSATVTWTAPVDGGHPITGYTVTASGGQTVDAGSSATSATVTGLANGTPYTFTVTASNAVGTGNPSDPSNAVVPATVPDRPANVVATVNGTDPHGADVSWSEPFNEGSPISSYAVTVSPGGATTTVSGNPPATTTTVGSLGSGSTYTFTVKATNALGTSAASDPSNALTMPVTPATPPGPPANVTASAGLGFVTVHWSAASADPSTPVTSYKVSASPGSVTMTTSGTATSVVMGGLARGSYTFTVTATNRIGSTSSAPTAPLAVDAAGQYHAMTPIRVLDTRDGEGGVQTGPLGEGRTLTEPMLGRFGVPSSGVAAVVMNVTVADATAPASYLSVYPTGSVTTLPPQTSNLNFVRGQIVPNLVVAALGTDGSVTAYNHSGSVSVIFDVQGWISTPTNISDTSGQIRAVAPVRLLDTRDATFGIPRLGKGTTVNLQVAGTHGVPTNASAVVLNVTAAGPTSPGFLTLFPTGSTRPKASNLNLVPNTFVSNRVIAKVGDAGAVSIFNAEGSVDVIVDLNGWFTDASSPAATGGEFTGVVPYRILDTRITRNTLGTVGTLTVSVAGTGGAGGVPAMTAANAPSAVVLNVTGTDTQMAGHLRVYPGDAGLPGTSDVNWSSARATVPNLVVVKLSHDGSVTLYNCCGSTNAIVDVLGWYSSPAQ